MEAQLPRTPIIMLGSMWRSSVMRRATGNGVAPVDCGGAARRSGEKSSEEEREVRGKGGGEDGEDDEGGVPEEPDCRRLAETPSCLVLFQGQIRFNFQVFKNRIDLSLKLFSEHLNAL